MPTDVEKKEECTYCFGSPENVDGDFCPECGQPSRSYMEFIYSEMEANGELYY